MSDSTENSEEPKKARQHGVRTAGRLKYPRRVAPAHFASAVPEPDGALDEAAGVA